MIHETLCRGEREHRIFATPFLKADPSRRCLRATAPRCGSGRRGLARIHEHEADSGKTRDVAVDEPDPFMELNPHLGRSASLLFPDLHASRALTACGCKKLREIPGYPKTCSFPAYLRRDSLKMTAPIRVTQVLEATSGGTRRHLREVVSALETEEFEVRIVCCIARDPAFRDDVIAYRERGHRVTILAMRPGLSPLHDGLAVHSLRQLLKSEPCDILHVHSAKAGWLGRLAARGLGCRVIYSPHAFPFLRSGPAIARFAYQLAERISAPWADVLLAVSEAEGRLAMESGLFAADHVRVLQNAVDLDDLDQSVAKGPAHRGRPPPRRFGLIGALRPQKGPFVLLEAARLLRDRGTPVPIVLPQRGPELPRVTQFIERHDLGSLTELVAAPGSLRLLLGRCDVAVLPSLWEGLPYSMLEALALRRPVIASDLPVFEDLLHPLDQRLIFPTGDVEELANRLALWAQLPEKELDDVGARGRQWVILNHDPAEWCRDLREIYRSTAGCQT